MGVIADRLVELGITLPGVAVPLATYVPAVQSGKYVYTSGQLPFVDGVLPARGKVGDGEGLVAPADAAGYARIAVLNALAAVGALIGDLDQIKRVVKVVGYVASDPAFTGQPLVVNGASDVLGAIFGVAGIHARSAVGVMVLPLDSPVELELLVELH